MYRNGFIDSKKPLAGQNDYRTSTYRGLIKMDEDIPTRTMRNTLNVCTKFEESRGYELPIKSEHQAEFQWKAGDPYVVRNPTTSGPKFMKSYEETQLRNAPKPMQAPQTIYKSHYYWNSKAYEEKPLDIKTINAVEPTKIICINPVKPGYGKFLDPSATTNSLTYLAYTTRELGIASKDNITLWNWKKEKKNAYPRNQIVCDNFPATQCPKRRREFQNFMKHVPHGGLKTETGSNYVTRLQHQNFDLSHIKNTFTSCHVVQERADAESKMYGSGKRIQNYI